MFSLKERGVAAGGEDRVNDRARKLGVTLILAFVVPVFILLLVYTRQFKELTDPDAMEIAAVARNMSQGQGFTTNVIRPQALTRSTDVAHMPDMMHPPLFIAALRLVFATDASDKKAAVASALFFLLTIPVLYNLTRAMFNVRVAQWTIFAYSCSVLMVNVSLSGTPATLATLCFTGLCLALLRYAQEAAESRPDPGPDGTVALPAKDGALESRMAMRGAVAGLLMGLCYLADYALLFAFLPVAVYVWTTGGRARRIGMGAFLLAFAVVGGSWMARNANVSGNPFFGLRGLEIGMGTKNHVGQAVYRSTVPESVLGLIQTSLSGIWQKLVAGVMIAYNGLPHMGQVWLGPFFLVGLFYSFKRTGVNALRGMLIASFLLVTVGSGLLIFQSGSVAPFAPIILAFAAAYFVRLLADAKLPDVANRAITVFGVIVLAMPFISFALTPVPASNRSHDVEGDLGHRVAAGVPIMTDRAAEMAWYGNKKAIVLPDSEKDVQNVDAILKQATGKAEQVIYLSADLNPTSGYRTAEDYGPWRNFYTQAYTRALQGQFARFPDNTTFAGYTAYQGLSPDDVVRYVRSGSLALFREDALKGQ